MFGTSLVVHWLRLLAPNARGLGSILGQGTRSHKPHLKERAHCKEDQRSCKVTAKTRRSQINIYIFKVLVSKSLHTATVLSSEYC